jgi:hypothetical protein
MLHAANLLATIRKRYSKAVGIAGNVKMAKIGRRLNQGHIDRRRLARNCIRR